MADGMNKPAIRFAGFTDAWEQRKLVNLCEKFTDGDWIEAKDQSNSGVRLIQTGNVGLGEYIDKPTNKKWISEETFERLNCEEVFAGDILISRLPEPAGRACIVPNLGTKMITAVDCTIIRTATQINSKYLLQYLSSQSYFDEVNTCLAGGTRQRISRSNLAAFDIPMPAKYEEQKAIGEFLCGMDNLITLHQREYAKLVNIKASMLEKMFPKDGSAYPEVRFAGFTDAWEQRKLVNLCEKFTDGDWIEAKDQSNSGVRLIQTGNVGLGEYIDKPTNKKWISEETFERLNCEEVFAGDILISRLPEPAGRACIVPNLGTKMITAVDCTIIRTATQINSKYLLQYLSSQSYFDEVNTCLAGGTRQRISRSNLAAFDIPMPAKYEEQKAIGEFLCGMDNLITLHQRKLEKLQNIKKSMLEKMFV